jgi:hypothetical protein
LHHLAEIERHNKIRIVEIERTYKIRRGSMKRKDGTPTDRGNGEEAARREKMEHQRTGGMEKIQRI